MIFECEAPIRPSNRRFVIREGRHHAARTGVGVVTGEARLWLRSDAARVSHRRAGLPGACSHLDYAPAANRRSEAEDVVQTTFLRALSNRSQFHGGNIRAWLVTIAKHSSCYTIRRQRREPLFEGRVDKIGENENDAAREAIAHLKNDRFAQRRLITLSFYGRMSHGQISAATHVPLGTLIVGIWCFVGGAAGEKRGLPHRRYVAERRRLLSEIKAIPKCIGALVTRM